MELKTKVNAEEGRQDLMITREFDLPLEWLFRAFAEPELVEQWMGTKVLKLESKSHGSYQFETTDAKGNKYKFNGVIHQFIPNRSITRTFEMENTLFGIQLEFYQFEPVTSETSKLQTHVIYESAAHREQALKVGMVKGINMAHNRLQDILSKLK
jgi:uncharacterized protein YndB with AHSA1/START domain